MRENRVILTQKDKLRILIDSESLDKLLSENNEPAQKLLRYSDAELFIFIRSRFATKEPELQKVVEFTRTHDDDDPEYVATKVYGKESPTESETESIILASIHALCHRCNDSDLLITNNETITKNRLWLESHFSTSPLNIMTIEEALQFMDLFAKYRNTYYASSHFFCDRSLWYLCSFQVRVTNYKLPWSCMVYGAPIKNGSEILQGFHSRFVYLLRAIDEIGFEYYKGVNNNTMSGMVYHLNYFITLVTGLFDSLAMLSLSYYNLQIKDVDISQRKCLYKLSLRHKDFLAAIDKKNRELHKFIIKNKGFVELFYPLREAIVHRSGLETADFVFMDKGLKWNKNMVVLPKNVANMIEELDKEKEYDPVTEWGLMNKSAVGYFLEPFNFVKATTEKLTRFCNGYLELLDFKQLLEKYPKIKQKIEEGSKSRSKRDFGLPLEIFKRDHLGF